MRLDPRSACRLRGGRRDRSHPRRPPRPAASPCSSRGARSMGFAGAFTAQASDPSAIFHNAAGIAFLKGTAARARAGRSCGRGRPSTAATPFRGRRQPSAPSTTTSCRPRSSTPTSSPSAWSWGGVDPALRGDARGGTSPDEFSGRFLAQRSSSNAYSLNPTVAYRLADRLAVGVGLDVRLSTVVDAPALSPACIP